MSAKITLGSTLGGLVLLIIIGVVVITGSKANEEAAKQAAMDSEAAKIISEQNYKDLEKLNQTISVFIDNWKNRVQISNKVQNDTQYKISQAVENILGNLSNHRNVTNKTFDHIQELLNTTNALTGPEYEKLADERTNRIIDNVTSNQKLIMQALNISKTDSETDTENDVEKLGQILKDFIQSQKVKPNESKRP